MLRTKVEWANCSHAINPSPGSQICGAQLWAVVARKGSGSLQYGRLEVRRQWCPRFRDGGKTTTIVSSALAPPTHPRLRQHTCHEQSCPPKPEIIVRPPGCFFWYSVTSRTTPSTTIPETSVSKHSLCRRRYIGTYRAYCLLYRPSFSHLLTE